MDREAVNSILERVRHLSSDERLALADEVDRLAWRDRMQSVLDEIGEARQHEGPPDDAEVEAIVNEVRAEKSLYERYWTRRRSSAP